MKKTVLLAILLSHAVAQVAWTPIFVDSNSQVDLWTQEAHGCRCPFDSKRQDCACCARDGACPCGRASPNRCTQCGLEEYCSNLCNVTIDSKMLSTRSGKTFGQIKSPSLEGPGSCFYFFQPQPGQRIELQIYRLVSVGKFNGSSCEGGYLQFRDGLPIDLNSSHEHNSKVCGRNERYAPPVVMFADKGSATLLFQITELTSRSQFLAYFSFTSASGNLGFHSRGGRRIPNTDCDWLYQDFACKTTNSCVIVSPGYPGLYSPNQLCKFLVATSSINTRIRILFSSILLPRNRCQSDNLKIYQGSASSEALLITICNKTQQNEYIFPGPNLLIEFRSGVTVPPYNYNGFRATLEFLDKPTTTESTINLSHTTDSSISYHNLVDGTTAPKTVQLKSNCDMSITGNATRFGTFDSRSRSWSNQCIFVFAGRTTDIVHVSFFNYILKATSCQSALEIYEGYYEEGSKPSLKICSPTKKLARDVSTGRFVEHQHFVSSGNVLTILFKRIFLSPFHPDMEFFDGAYLFHDQKIDGTLQPATLCDVDYFGLSSENSGVVTNPGTEDIYFNIERAIKCSQKFFPAVNQSVTLTIGSYTTSGVDPKCHTRCGDIGCRCVPNNLTLDQVDHLIIETEDKLGLLCVCGKFQVVEEWLPLTLQTWSPVTLSYAVAHYSWEKKGFKYTANYSFTTDSMCGHHTLTDLSGKIGSADFIPSGQLTYYHQFCTWLLDLKVERQLFIEITTAQSRVCTAWNISLHAYSDSSADRAGDLLYTFCPRERHKEYKLNIDIVLIRLQASTQTLPQFSINWSSQPLNFDTQTFDPYPPKNIKRLGADGSALTIHLWLCWEYIAHIILVRLLCFIFIEL